MFETVSMASPTQFHPGPRYLEKTLIVQPSPGEI